jgi:hypothetical protein
LVEAETFAQYSGAWPVDERPRLIDDIDDRDQLSLVGSVGDEGDSTRLYESIERLKTEKSLDLGAMSSLTVVFEKRAQIDEHQISKKTRKIVRNSEEEMV